MGEVEYYLDFRQSSNDERGSDKVQQSRSNVIEKIRTHEHTTSGYSAYIIPKGSPMQQDSSLLKST